MNQYNVIVNMLHPSNHHHDHSPPGPGHTACESSAQQNLVIEFIYFQEIKCPSFL